MEFFVVLVLLAIPIGFVWGVIYLVKLSNKETKKKKLDDKKIEPCLIWAKEKGYVLPSKPSNSYWIFIIIGCLVGLIPGLIIIFFYNQQKATYDKEVRILMNKWIDQGSPRI